MSPYSDAPDSSIPIPEINPEEAATDIERRRLIAIDVRGDDAYRTGHLPGAIHVPFDRLDDYVAAGHPESRLLVACGGGGLARKAVARLLDQGVDAVSLAGGTRGWIAEGFPVESDRTGTGSQHPTTGASK